MASGVGEVTPLATAHFFDWGQEPFPRQAEGAEQPIDRAAFVSEHGE